MRKMARKSMGRRVEKLPTGAAINKGSWTAEEDRKLADYVRVHGDKKWRTFPMKAGLNRCGKSCRLRWLNYLRPGIKRGNISEDEENLIIRLHNLLGNKWSLIAGRLPGRTDNEIKNHWNSHLSKKALTIHDLNSKQCQGNAESLHAPPMFSSPRPSGETLQAHAVCDEQTSPAMLELQGLLSMPSPQLLKEVEYDMDMLGSQEQCQSFSMLSFQPPNTLESFAFEDVMCGGYMDCEGYDFLYFPPL